MRWQEIKISQTLCEIVSFQLAYIQLELRLEKERERERLSLKRILKCEEDFNEDEIKGENSQ